MAHKKIFPPGWDCIMLMTLTQNNDSTMCSVQRLNLQYYLDSSLIDENSKWNKTNSIPPSGESKIC